MHGDGQIIADQQPYLGDLTSWRKWQAWRRQLIQKYDTQRDRYPMTALTTHMGKATPATREIVTWSRYLAAGPGPEGLHRRDRRERRRRRDRERSADR